MIALSTAQPYPGLRPFDLGDQDFFFGREAQVRALREKLRTSRLIAVVGRSGCGKSSLVRAGLIPPLLEDVDASAAPRWHVATFRPQGRPIAELATALLNLKAQRGHPDPDGETPDSTSMRRSRMEAMLRRSSFGLVEAAGELGMPPSAHLLIVVDQFEEIFRFETAAGSDADEPTAFVRLLLAAAEAATPQIHILLTMRLDFLGDCARFQGLPEAISDGQFLVPNLNRAERRDAIEKPAQQCGRTVSPALTQRLLNDIGDDPDQLPVLQHVLMRTWMEAGAAETLELAHYDATGGLKDAISHHADVVLGKLSASDQRVVERVFKALADLDRRGRAIRRPQRLHDLAGVAATDDETVVRIVESFRAPENCFLMPPVPEELSGATLVDISHESLLRRWEKMIGEPPKRDGWLVEEDRDGKIYRGLRDAAETSAGDEAAVLPPALARQRQAWWDKAKPNAAWAERYGAKFEAVGDLLKESTRREYRQRLTKYALLGLLAFAVISIPASIAGTVAFYSGEQKKTAEALKAKKEAEDARAVAETARQEAEAAREKAERALNDVNAKRIENDKQVKAAVEASAQASALKTENLELQRENEKLQRELVARGATPNAPPPIEAARSQTVDQDGFMWVGSARNSFLRNDAGGTIDIPDDVKKGQAYIVSSDINLRQALPDKDYVQAPSIGTVLAGSRIQALSVPVGFSRSLGVQYWIPIRILAQGQLPTVYFHFATAMRGQVEAVSKQLKDMGYAIPGEERLDAAQGKREVRYFYPQDEIAARKLAQDTGRALQAAGHPSTPPIAVKSLTDFAGKKNAPGVVELWLDLPARAATAN